jgi:hypothetical protein
MASSLSLAEMRADLIEFHVNTISALYNNMPLGDLIEVLADRVRNSDCRERDHALYQDMMMIIRRLSRERGAMLNLFAETVVGPADGYDDLCDLIADILIADERGYCTDTVNNYWSDEEVMRYHETLLARHD